MFKLATKLKADEPLAFRKAEAAGFGYAELWLGERLLSPRDWTAAQAKQSALGFGLHFPNRGDLSETVIREALALYHDLDCSAMVIHAPMLRRYGAWIAEHDSHVRLGVENHRLTPDQLQLWATENQWLTLDVEHLWRMTLSDCDLDLLLEAVDGFLRRYREKLIHVHLPGYLPGQDEHRPMFCSRDMVMGVFSLLADHQYDGLVVSEVDAEFQNLAELRMDVLLYERWQELRLSAHREREA